MLFYLLNGQIIHLPEVSTLTEASKIFVQESVFPGIDESKIKFTKKIKTVATELYGAAEVKLSPAVKKQLEDYQKLGFGDLPICMAKTQYSFSSDPKKLGAPTDHILEVQSVRLSAGAGFVVVVCGEMMLMPGLPKIPASSEIDCDENGVVSGL